MRHAACSTIEAMTIRTYDGKKPCAKCGVLLYAHERRSAGDRLSSNCKPCDNRRKAAREKRKREAARAATSQQVVATPAPSVVATAPAPADPKALVELARLKRQLAEANGRVTALSAHAEALESALEAQQALAAAIRDTAAQEAVPQGPFPQGAVEWVGRKAPKAKKLRTGAFVALASDWHVEETVTLEATSGVNQYNLTIAADRIRQFGEGIARLHEFHRNMFDIPHIVLGMMGDFFSGSIHPENVETQALSPIESVAWLNQHIIQLIDGILRDTGLKAPGSLIIPFTWGNHGRITKRTHISTNAQNNLEYLIADTVRLRYANDPRVTVLAPKANHVYVDLWNKTIRFTHLDAIKYQGGVGGLTVPLNKAIVAWNRARHADVTCGGHWHQYLALPEAVVNGSLIGYNPYAEWIRASPEKPQQATFVLDSQHGKCLDTPIWIS